MSLPAWFQQRGRWICAIAGAAMPLAFAPFELFWLMIPLLFVLLLSWQGQSAREAAWRGFWFGVGAFGAGTYWLYISIHIFGGSPLWLALFLMCALVLIMALFSALAGWLYARLRSDSPLLSLLLLFPASWVLVEWLRGWIFTGFPWLSLGYAQVDGPLAGWAPLGGVYAVSLVSALITGCLACLLLAHRVRERLAVAILLALIALTSLFLQGQLWTRASGPAVTVALVQGSISQDRKWLPEQRRPTLQLYRELTLAHADADLMVWPEVAIPAMQHQVETYLDELDQLAAERSLSLLLGVLVYDFDNEQFYNALISLGEARGVYNKRHLVPFGEFFPVPDFVRNWMRLMSLPYRDTAHGEHEQSPLQAAGLILAPSICYEDAYGGEQRDFLPQASALVNVSNDAWFGDSVAPHQHLQIARMRALETGRFMLRTTNTGITAIIDPRGRVVAGSPQFETHVLRGEIIPYAGATPFVRFGNMPVVLLALLALGLPVASRRFR